MVDGWWEARNARLGWALAARWDRGEFPFLTLWTEHRQRATAPWATRERTRGMELSTKPFPVPRSYAGPDGMWQGAPVGCPLPPGRTVTKTVHLTWSRLAPAS